MCMLCAEDALLIGSVAIMGAPWYRSLWQRIWKVGEWTRK